MLRSLPLHKRLVNRAGGPALYLPVLNPHPLPSPPLLRATARPNLPGAVLSSPSPALPPSPPPSLQDYCQAILPAPDALTLPMCWTPARLASLQHDAISDAALQQQV